MQVVHTSAHMGHDPASETIVGESVPAYEVPERAELIRAALESDGGHEFVAPTEHGEEPITAVHDPGLVRFLEEAWSELRRQSVPARALLADSYPNPAMVEGMSGDAVARMREPTGIVGRAGWWGLDTATPIVPGTYAAARGAVDVALTTLDLVLGGEQAAYGLCRPPGHHAARAMFAGYGEGSGENLNIPLPAGTPDAVYLEALDRALDAIDRVPGSLVIVSLGFDTYGLDPISDFALTTPAYHEMGTRVAALGRRLVILQEGGYHRPSLGQNARAWLGGAEGRAFDPRPPGGVPAGSPG